MNNASTINESLGNSLNNLRYVVVGIHALENVKRMFKHVAPMSTKDQEWVDLKKKRREEKKSRLRDVFDKRNKGETFVSIAKNYGVAPSTVNVWFCQARRMNDAGWLFS